MTDADVHTVLRRRLPGYRVGSVVRLGEGLDNMAYEVNGELIVRFGKQVDAARVEREARLLAAVAGFAPLPVPRPRFTDPELGCLGYDKLPGRPLLDLPGPHRPARAAGFAAPLGRFLAALHTGPAGSLDGLVEVDDEPLTGWHAEAARLYAEVTDAVPAAHHHAVQAFLAAPPPGGGYPLVFSHNDLGIEHVLVDPDGATVTGVLDWSDAALVDPARDIGRLYRDLGPAGLDALLASYRPAATELAPLRERAEFYARCGVFEDLAYGLDTGDARYVDKSRTALRWLFPG